MTTDPQNTDPETPDEPVGNEHKAEAEPDTRGPADAQNDAQHQDTATGGNDDTLHADEQAGDANGRANREAAKWRKQLRATEAERDALAARVDVLQRAAVESASSLDRPATLWLTGVSPADLIDAGTGTVDAEALRACEAHAVEEFGLRRALGGTYVPGEGSNPTVQGDAWTDAFR